MKTLRDVTFRKHYDPAVDGCNLTKDFYVPCLSVSVRYDRRSAYFSSAVLKSFSRGLFNLFENGGHIRFIFSCQVDSDDRDNIQNGYVKRRENRARAVEQDKAILSSDFEVANLGYLIEHKLADVKIAFRRKEKASICHIKRGLFEDREGNLVYFSGSGNETINGTSENAEVYTVSGSFLSAEQKEEALYGRKRFDDIWNNHYSSTVHSEYPIGALFERLKSFSQGKRFSSAKEFYSFKDCVVIDVDESKGSILLSDYTKGHALRIPRILKTYFSSGWNQVENDQYEINPLSLHTLRDKVIKFLAKSSVAFLLTPTAEDFLKKNNLELEKRRKLGILVKDGSRKEIWGSSFIKFKNIVDSERMARLKDKQRVSAFYHYQMVSSADFSVPGTGKTYISYGLFAFLSSLKIRKVDHLVVFGPLNCFKAWKEEGESIFSGKRSLSFFDVTQHKSDYVSELTEKKFNVYLFNYDFLGNNNEAIGQKISVLSKEVLNGKAMVVFDEIHKLKSLSGVRANNFLSLLEQCNEKPIYRLALTGTPLPNSFKDILNCLKILYPEDLSNLFPKIGKNYLGSADSNPVVAKEIQTELYPFFIRTTKKDLAVPPPDPNDYSSLLSVPGKDEANLFQVIWKNYLRTPLLMYIRLIQASSNPSLLRKRISWQEIEQIEEDDDPSVSFETRPNDSCNKEVTDLAKLITRTGKRKLTLAKIQELVNQGKKVLVWCLFIDTIDRVTSSLKKIGISALSICGQDDISLRSDKIDLFKFKNISVLVTNPNTLAESVSLHRVCHDAIYLEYGFNLTYRLQSKDRINRVGLKEGTHTHYYYAITKSERYGSIDSLILDRLQEKEERRLSVIESNGLVVPKDQEDWRKDVNDILEKGRLL